MLERFVNWLKRIWTIFKLHSVEADIAGIEQLLQEVREPELRAEIHIIRARQRRALVRIRGELTALYPPGTRFTWDEA